MRISLYDEALNKIDDLSSQFVSCLWNEEYNGVGAFALEVRATKKNKSTIRPDLYVKRQDRKTLMVIKSVQMEQGIIIATGCMAMRVLDDVAFIGTISAGMPIVTAVKNAYNNSNRFPAVVIADSDLTDTYDEEISHKSILELCEIMGQSKDVGFKSIKNGSSIEIQAYKPLLNESARFSEIFGNIGDVSLILSTENYKNYAKVLGEGEGEARVLVDVDLTGGAVRRELIVDARDIQQEENETATQYQARLKARGYEALLEQVESWECSFVPSAQSFGKKFDIGDLAVVGLPSYGLKFQTRITGFEEKEQNNQTELSISVGSLQMISSRKR